MKSIFPITKERYSKYAIAKVSRINPPLSDWGGQFTPFSRGKKDSDCCVITNGIGKSGTHLLDSILKYLGAWENIGVWIGVGDWRSSSRPQRPHLGAQRFAIKKMRNGQMAAGDLPWSEPLARSFREDSPARRIKHLMIYRDPRDRIVSMMNWITYKDTYSITSAPSDINVQRFMEDSFSSDDERLTHVIQQLKYDTVPRFIPWLQDPNCFPVRFEELYPEILDLEDNVMGDFLKRLLNYLEIDPDTIDPIDFFDKVNGKSATASQVRNKVGQYKRVFKDHHYALLDNPEFRNLLTGFGYEW